MKVGQKSMQCLACGHVQVIGIKERPSQAQCDNCESHFMKPIKVKPTDVHGIGRNKVADLGLALLIDMAGQYYDADVLKEI